MIFILSSAKTMNFKQQGRVVKSQSVFGKETAKIASAIRMFSSDELAALLKVNSKMAQLNHLRFQEWIWPHKADVALQAVLAYDGTAFQGLNAATLTDANLAFAQKHMRILSALYGVLRPMDLIMPYRLEMQTPVWVGPVKNLYNYWNTMIAKSIEIELKSMNNHFLVNLASEEYSKAVIPHLRADINVINIIFKENRNGKLVNVTVHTKFARGLMARFIIENRITNSSDLEAFDMEGYRFDLRSSGKNTKTFIRG
ncbi:MAG: hypothetical protein CVU11_01335 [Bacteroidetes bacterium HGW-Bacteroidetes-6]|jgi:hypothetical protein|nr:MAG: hypothetical protein CVU11_01335 [Bacteroidetes bacterium HGW-Bacteroidetes-6]